MADTAALDSDASQFKSALAADDDWSRTVMTCLRDLEPLPQGANLGFVYATDGLAADLGSVVTLLRARTGIEHWCGTVGLGVMGCGVEYFDRPALSVLVCALPPDSFRVFGPVSGELSDWRREHGPWLAEQGPVFGVLQADPRTPDLPALIGELSAISSSFFVGGLTSSRGELPQVADHLATTAGGAMGVSGVLFDRSLQVATGLTQGCSPISPYRTITAAERNVIKEIDDRPALEVFKDDIGELLARDLRRVAGYINVAFPVPGHDSGDYLVRNLVAIDPERGWLGVGEQVEPGRRVLFVRRDHDAALRDLARMLEEVVRRAGDKPRAALYFSCVARGPNLFGPNSEELQLLRKHLGDLPLSGFFANGEISNDRLYGYTGVLTLIL